MKDAAHPICRSLPRRLPGAGLSAQRRFQRRSVEGAGIYDINTRDGRRCSSSFAYLHPALHRPNLTVEHHAVAEKLLIDADGRATAVQVTQYGQTKVFRARGEIVLAAGAIDSPNCCSCREWPTARCSASMAWKSPTTCPRLVEIRRIISASAITTRPTSRR